MYKRIRKSKSRTRKKGGNSYTLVDLKKAIDNKDIEEVSKILRENIELNTRRDADGYTPLHFACTKDDDNISYDLVKLIFEKGSDINTETNHEYSILHTLVISINDFHVINGMDKSPNKIIEILDFLLEKGIDVNSINEDYQTPIFFSANTEYHNYELISLLFKYGANPNITALNDQFAIYKAFDSGAGDEIIDLFLKNGSYVPAYDDEINLEMPHTDEGPPDVYEYEPLNKQIELQNNVFNIRFTNEYIDRATSGDDIDNFILSHIKRLENNGISTKTIIKTRNEHGESILHLICDVNAFKSLKYLEKIENLYNLNMGNYTNLTPLHYATQSGSIEIVELFIKNFSNLRIKSDKLTLIDFALKESQVYDVANLLINHGADWSPDFSEYTPDPNEPNDSAEIERIEELKITVQNYQKRSDYIFRLIKEDKLNEFEKLISKNEDKISLHLYYTLDKNGNSPLHVAVELMRIAFIHTILKYFPQKADILNLKNDKFQSPLDVSNDITKRILIEHNHSKQLIKGNSKLKRKSISKDFLSDKKRSKQIFYSDTGAKIGSFLGGKFRKNNIQVV